MFYRISLFRYPFRIGRSCVRGALFVVLAYTVFFLAACAADLARLPASHFELADTLPAAALATRSENGTVDIPALPQPTGGLLASYEKELFRQDKALSGASGSVPHILEQETNEQTALFSVDAINAPVESLLFALAGDADLRLRILGQLSATVSLRADQKTLSYLLDTLADQAGFSWHRENTSLVVRSGESYGYSYAINYLNMSRRTESRVGLATQVGTINAADDGVGSVANSSQTMVENLSEHHFWESLELDVAGLTAADGADSGMSTPATTSARYSINKEAGLLTLFAKPSVHNAVQSYLKLLNNSSQRQVLIEATVVEVALSDSFEAGVDWQLLARGINGVSAAQILAGAPLLSSQTIGRLANPAGLVSLVQQTGDHDVQATLSLLEQFGEVSILSRPRIIALNNQSSVLKVVDNRVYFTVNVQRRQNENDDEIETETEIHTVPVGLVMNVTPQISAQGSVMLNVRPTLSRILGFVNDPNPQLAQANVRNGVPEIQVREMETMLQVQSGHVAVIGGLMQETNSDNDSQLPGLGRLAGIGRLFRSKARERQQTELLIVIKPTVIDSAPVGPVHE